MGKASKATRGGDKTKARWTHGPKAEQTAAKGVSKPSGVAKPKKVATATKKPEAQAPPKRTTEVVP